MLLTSSQVSLALSSGIVIIFTAALFLSGYAIQQRTLRDLRAAIRAPPRPSPKLLLPDRFREATTETDDGTVAALGAASEELPPGHADADDADAVVVEVRPSAPEPDGPAGEAGAQKPLGRAERRRRIRDEIKKMAELSAPAAYQPRLY